MGNYIYVEFKKMSMENVLWYIPDTDRTWGLIVSLGFRFIKWSELSLAKILIKSSISLLAAGKA